MYQMDVLPRRAFLGVEIAPPGSPLVVGAVEPAGTAAGAGVLPGDVLTALDGHALRDATALIARVRTLQVGRPVTFRVTRAGQTRDLVGEAARLPIEQLEGCEVLLGHVEVDGHKLRTFVTLPEGRDPDAAVLYLQGIGCESCESPFDPDNPARNLVEGWTRAGLMTMRLERSGVGDSEGPPCLETGLAEEIAGYRAALAELTQHTDRVFLFGHSLGGMVAPLLAKEQALAGVAVFGTSALPWYDCIVATHRRQRELAGAGNVDAEMADWAEVYRLVVREGSTPDEVFARRPALARLRTKECTGRHLFGRHVSLSQALDRADLIEAWRALAAPVLVLRGEHDWVTSRAEGEAIAGAARSGRYVELPRIGHDYLAYESLAQSFAHRGEGRWDGSVVEATRAWAQGPATP